MCIVRLNQKTTMHSLSALLVSAASSATLPPSCRHPCTHCRNRLYPFIFLPWSCSRTALWLSSRETTPGHLMRCS
ncbi:hypothetical protein F5Y18DRAFT_57736 [Xylariaceae sp. FL1019]|nr:hypothetical protein F5Y18DRAFT_57736 [Xylariaceae sp. FL1019]